MGKWPHLKHVCLPEIDADVEILMFLVLWSPLKLSGAWIGGPVKTVLGWTVNGPLGGRRGSPGCQSAVSVNRISAITLDELWNKQLRLF